MDLSLEGPAWKISRKQGMPTLHSTGDRWGCPEPLTGFSRPWCLENPSDLVRKVQGLGALRSLPWGCKYLRAVIPRKQKDTGLALLFVSVSSFLFLSASTGVIKLKNNGDFFIANEGRRPIYIDGRPVLCGSKWRLSNNSVVEVSWGGGESHLVPD